MEGGARRGHADSAAVGWWGAASRHSLARLSARRPAHSPYKESLAKGCVRGGSAPPNGSRLSCGRPARRRKVVGRSPCPARGTTLRFLKAITARQLQALVRRRYL